MAGPEPGRLVLLNGPSSAGKSSLAAALVDLLDTPWHVVPVDLLHSTRSRPDLRDAPPLSAEAWQAVFRATRAGYHRALAGLVRGGCDVVGDHVLGEVGGDPWRLTDLLAVTAGLDVLLVDVTCSPHELGRREAARGDREAGTALAQLGVVFAHDDRDLLVDSTSSTPAECARLVASLVASPPADRAVDRLRARVSSRRGPVPRR